jgi:hypothetical protein
VSCPRPTDSHPRAGSENNWTPEATQVRGRTRKNTSSVYRYLQTRAIRTKAVNKTKSRSKISKYNGERPYVDSRTKSQPSALGQLAKNSVDHGDAVRVFAPSRVLYYHLTAMKSAEGSLSCDWFGEETSEFVYIRPLQDDSVLLYTWEMFGLRDCTINHDRDCSGVRTEAALAPANCDLV